MCTHRKFAIKKKVPGPLYQQPSSEKRGLVLIMGIGQNLRELGLCLAHPTSLLYGCTDKDDQYHL